MPFLSLVTLPEPVRNPTVKEEASASGLTALNGATEAISDGFLLDGSAVARAIAQDTLRQVSAAIDTQY